MPSLIRPVLISGPFYYAVVDKHDVNAEMQRCVSRKETGQTVSRAMATGRPPGSAANERNGCKPVVRRSFSHPRTSDHFASVIYNALMILVRSVREVHADCVVAKLGSQHLDIGGIDIEIGRTDVDTGPSKFGQLLRSVNLWP